MRDELYKKSKWLTSVVSECEKNLVKLPDAKIDSRNNGRKVAYFKEGVKADERQLECFSKRKYYSKVLKVAKSELYLINRLLNFLQRKSIVNVFYKLRPELRKFVTPFVMSDEDYAKKWQSVKYEGRTFDKDEVPIFTEKGERVRSKSEALIANKLNALHIPYRYEYPIIYGDNSIIYPDFTILNKRTRQEIILEHFGMMEKESYRKIFFEKQKLYSKLGYVQGVNFFMTFEDNNNAFNSEVFSEMTKKLFM